MEQVLKLSEQEQIEAQMLQASGIQSSTGQHTTSASSITSASTTSVGPNLRNVEEEQLARAIAESTKTIHNQEEDEVKAALSQSLLASSTPQTAAANTDSLSLSANTAIANCMELGNNLLSNIVVMSFNWNKDIYAFIIYFLNWHIISFYVCIWLGFSFDSCMMAYSLIISQQSNISFTVQQLTQQITDVLLAQQMFK